VDIIGITLKIELSTIHKHLTIEINRRNTPSL